MPKKISCNKMLIALVGLVVYSWKSQAETPKGPTVPMYPKVTHGSCQATTACDHMDSYLYVLADAQDGDDGEERVTNDAEVEQNNQNPSNNEQASESDKVTSDLEKLFDVKSLLPAVSVRPEVELANKQRNENIEAAMKKVEEHIKAAHPEATQEELNRYRGAVDMARANFMSAKSDYRLSLGLQAGTFGGHSDVDERVMKFSYDYFKERPDEASQLAKSVFLAGDFDMEYDMHIEESWSYKSQIEEWKERNLAKYNEQLKMLNKYFQDQDNKK